MNCGLGELYVANDSEKRLNANDLKAIVDSFVTMRAVKSDKKVVSSTVGATISDSIKRVSSPLQSVQEESEASDSSGVERRHAKRKSKPSKRSRVK
jgi:hypothetical protein